MSPASIVSTISRNLRTQAGRAGFAKLAAAGGAVAFALTLAVGAGAAPSPVDPLAEVLGMNGTRGPDVSEAAQNAQAEAEDTDAQVGVLVSEAVCRVVSDETNLPEPAQDAPGHANRDPEDCVHPANAESQDIEDQDVDEQEDEDVSNDEVQADDEEDENENDNRGSMVSQAAHDAKAAAREAGEKVGPAVSEAVCRVNSDKTNLPEPAQDAPGHANRDPEDCVHPSNAGDGETLDSDNSGEVESGSHGNGHGRQNAPGQQKKQSN